MIQQTLSTKRTAEQVDAASVTPLSVPTTTVRRLTEYKPSHKMPQSRHGFDMGELTSFLIKSLRRAPACNTADAASRDAFLQHFSQSTAAVLAEMDVSGRGAHAWDILFTFALEDVGLGAAGMIHELFYAHTRWLDACRATATAEGIGKTRTSHSARCDGAPLALATAAALLALQPKSRLVSCEAQFATMQASLQLPAAATDAPRTPVVVQAKHIEPRSFSTHTTDAQERLLTALRTADHDTAVRIAAVICTVLDSVEEIKIDARYRRTLDLAETRHTLPASAMVYACVLKHVEDNVINLGAASRVRVFVKHLAHLHFALKMASPLHCVTAAVLACFHQLLAPHYDAVVALPPQWLVGDAPLVSSLYANAADDLTRSADVLAARQYLTIPDYVLDKHTNRGKGRSTRDHLIRWALHARVNIATWPPAEIARSHGAGLDPPRGQDDFYTNSLHLVNDAVNQHSAHESLVRDTLVALESAHGTRACKQARRVERFYSEWLAQVPYEECTSSDSASK